MGSFWRCKNLISITSRRFLQIQKLESDLGTILIVAVKTAQITDSDRLFFLSRIYNEEHIRLHAALGQAQNDVAGELKIAASTILGIFVTGEFMASHPDITARVDIMDSATVIDSVKYGDYKLGLCGSTPPETDGLSSFKLASDEIVLVAAPGHPLTTKQEVNLSEIVKYSFICREVTSGTRLSLERSLANRNFELEKLKIRLVFSNKSQSSQRLKLETASLLFPVWAKRTLLSQC